MLPNHNQVLLSNDGSHTVFSSKFDVSYHSKHGAITESNVVFIDSGLKYLINTGSKTIKIFEMGLGTALNVHLTFQEAITSIINIEYSAIEAFPLKIEEIDALNYCQILGDEPVFKNWHQLSWQQSHKITDNFQFTKIQGELQEFSLDNTYHLIYYDAFGPRTQPELWDLNMMQKMYSCLEIGGILVTYCAQGQFKRNLKSAGFTIEELPGPPGKREMIRATK
jgi:tRNA U34 5-methylaminomethyl-2-thiouridine-forming methyltransferase MnmC